MQVHTLLKFPLRFGNDSSPHQENASPEDDGVHLGDLRTWLLHNLTQDELVIAQRLADMARSEGIERTEQSKERARAGRSGAEPPNKGPSPHIVEAMALAKQFPGIKLLGEVIGQKIAKWRQNPKKSPFGFFAKLSDAIRQLNNELHGISGETDTTEQTRSKPRRGDFREARRAGKRRWSEEY